MVIDQHFWFIALAWLAGIAGIAGLALWIALDRRALDAKLAELDARGLNRRGGERG